MSKTLHKLMYVSSATNLLNAEELYSLISQSQLKNAHFGVTGCIIYHDGNILQYIEGTRASIDFIYDSIVLDSRHTGIQRLCYEPVEQRSFSDWTMALKYIPDTEYDYTSLYELFEDIMEKNRWTNFVYMHGCSLKPFFALISFKQMILSGRAEQAAFNFKPTWLKPVTCSPLY